MTLTTKELEEKLNEQGGHEACYTNYTLAIFDDGVIRILNECLGHDTLYKAIECKEHCKTTVEALTKVALGFPKIREVHHVILKETYKLEIVEE